MRTDEHRPSVINPDEYTFVAFDHIKIEGFGDCAYMLEQRQYIQIHMKRTGGTYSAHEHGGNCHICGASAIYTALFYHEKTNTYIRTGQDCAQKLEMSSGDWNNFRRAIHNALEARAGKKKAAALLALEGLTAAWDIYIAESPKCTCTDEWCSCISMWNRTHKEEVTITDIVGKLVQYGRLTDPQLNFVRSLLARIANRPAIEAQRAIERESAADCPTGRVKITGTVLTIREDESDFGTVTRMLFKDDSGFRVWGSRPTGTNAEPGDRLSFFGAVTPSDTDKKFGFFKRPTKATVIAKKEP